MDPDLVVPDKSKSIMEGAVALIGEPRTLHMRHILEGLARHYGFSLNTPWSDLTEEQRNAVLYGTGRTRVEFVYTSTRGHKWRHRNRYGGIIRTYERRFSETTSEGVREHLGRFIATVLCHTCKGGRLRPESVAVTVAGRSIVDVVRMSIDEASGFFGVLFPQLTDTQRLIGEELIKEIRGRLGFL